MGTILHPLRVGKEGWNVGKEGWNVCGCRQDIYEPEALITDSFVVKKKHPQN